MMERVARLETKVEGLQTDIDSKHRENRKSIHDLKDSQQTVIDILTELRLKFARSAGWAVGAGSVIALISHFIDRIK